MNVPRSFTRLLPSWRKLHRGLTICVLVSLLAGLIPPPLARSVVESTLPAALAAPAADAAEALLPDVSVAQAAPVTALPMAPCNGRSLHRHNDH